MNEQDKITLNQIRMLSAEMIQKANSGHPGLPLGAAPIAYTIFHHILKFDPTHPDWVDRDRFVLSAGHGSAMLYSMLHLYGYEIDMHDIKNFRQLGSRTPGHPEYWCVPGVETSTGPLGAGFSNAVGMALAERRLNAMFGDEIIDHKTIVITSDGDFEEGISSEAASFAGKQQLEKLVVFYDSNGISIEGDVKDTFIENVEARFSAVNWHVESVNGEDPADILNAYKRANAFGEGKPKLIICKTIIAKDAEEKEGTAGAHGSPLGDEILAKMREKYGYTEEFYIDPNVIEHIKVKLSEKRPAFEAWDDRFVKWMQENPEKYQAYKKVMGKVAMDIEYPVFEEGESLATRKSSNKILNAIADAVPSFMGGSADLAPSNGTWLNDKGELSPENPLGRNIHFGIREHAMGGIVNGMALHGGVIPFGATFLVFSDYMRGAVRLSALIGAKAIWIFTHDSFFVGEDGPTHQPIEHIDALRLIPNLKVIRPADAKETIAAYKFALKHQGPVAIILTRQGVPLLENSSDDPADLTGKVVYEGENAKVQLFASGSEVSLAIEASRILKEHHNIDIEVISVPLLSLSDPGHLASFSRANDGKVKIALEAGTTRVYGSFGIVERIGLNRYGESAPASRIAEHLGFTPAGVAKRVSEIYLSYEN